jgi:hypothetical protein
MFEQERVLVRLQQYVLRESDILVCYLAGSFGRRQEDEYSDMDVGLVFANDAKREWAWQKRRDLVNEAMPYVPARSFDAEHIRPFFHIALYSNGAKVDYRFETQTDLQPNPWDRDLRILKDTADQWGEQYQHACRQLYFQQPRITATELAAIDDRFWVMFWDVFRLVLRGDIDKPFTIYLELLQFSLPPLLNVLPPEDPAYAGLQRAYFGPDTKATLKQLAQLLEAYVAARTAVIRRLNLMFEVNQSFESGIRKLVERHA